MTDQGSPVDQARFASAELERFAMRALESIGMRAEDAAVLADNLVDTELRGVETHGMARLQPYMSQMTSGDVALRPEIVLDERTPVAASIDGGGGFGVIAGVRAMSWAVEAAQRSGLAMAGVRNVGHFGTASYYTRAAARQGMVGIAMTNTSPVVAPGGGADARLGNNPLSIAVPDGSGGTSFCLDVAMSVVSRGRVKLYSIAGEEMPPGLAVDADGNPTTDADAGLDGALLPFGDYKGSGLSMAIEILAAALTGAQLTQDVRHGGFTSSKHVGSTQDERAVTVGNLYLAIDPGLFRSVQDFRSDVDDISTYVRGSRPRAGQTVQIAGEPEDAVARERTEHGIPLSRSTLSSLQEVAALCGLDAPSPLTEIAAAGPGDT